MQILECIIEHKEEMRTDFHNPQMPWHGSELIISKLVYKLGDVMKLDAQNLR